MNVKEKFEMGVKEVTDARVKERNEYVLKSQEAFQRGKFEEAINYIVKASVIDSFNPKIWLSKAQLCELVGDPLEALDCYVKALILSPKDLEAQDGRDRLLALTPEQMEALKWMKKGQRAHQKGQIEEALALVEKALEYGPLDSKVWDYKGVVLYDLMQPQAALKRPSNSTPAILMLGCIREWLMTLRQNQLSASIKPSQLNPIIQRFYTIKG